MKPVADLTEAEARGLVGIFCDIDDTLTWEGRIVPEAFAALGEAHMSGLRIIPITGRPGGWVDHIARMWPVDGVVGENGGLWFYMNDQGLQRGFLQQEPDRRANRERLEKLAKVILERVPGTALASDQSYRDLDLAIDFCEDVDALDDLAIDEIVRQFRAAGATAKVSSIHVNGWYGDFDKLTGCREIVRALYAEELDPTQWAYFGDSANDEPMFKFFDMSIGVANVRDFLGRMESHPTYICEGNGGHGFAEGARRILELRS
ncbi:MAG: HAD family phosphatase [Proteobacteria bacterium]|nr:HAD family phosphatase [Pseudomonadota bacterium]